MTSSTIILFVNEISRLCLLMDFHQDQESKRFLTEMNLILNPLTAERLLLFRPQMILVLSFQYDIAEMLLSQK